MESLRSQFLLNPAITFLNFGSFGACPKPVFADYQRWQLELEQEPVQFITVKGPKYLQSSREALANFVHCDADDLVYVMNPSYAVNIIAKSLDLKKGDEILTTNLEYGACDKAWEYYCQQKGAKYVRQTIDFPIVSKEQVIEQIQKGLTAKTKMLFISHITSATALILPVEELCEWAKSKGLMTFVDGAHGPGHIALNLSTLNADIYTGACHKWMMTAKGCSFLYVKKEYQALFDPLIVSWGYDSSKSSPSFFLDYHQMQGTRDFAAFLTVPSAIQFMKEHNWETVAANCRKMVKDNAQRFIDLMETEALCPISDDFLGQMLSIKIRCKHPEKLKADLYDLYQIEIPVMQQGENVYIRYSVQGFTSQADLDRLYEALAELKNRY